MRARGKLILLFTFFAALALVAGSGAFTSTAADRTMSVGVANDSAALLGLAPNASNPNGDYASFTDDRIEVDVSNANLDADTHINHVLNLSNNGNSQIYVWVDLSGTNTSSVILWEGPVDAGTAIPESDSSTVIIDPGQTVSISIQIDTLGTSDSAGTSLVDTVTIHAASA